MNTNETLPATPAAPVFEGFFLQMVSPGMDQRAREVVLKCLDTSWELKPIGDASTQFEVFQNELTSGTSILTTKEVWEVNYRLRAAPGVIDAEPLFGVPLPERPIYKSTEFSPDANAAFSLDIDLPESDDANWSLNQLHVFEAWEEFFPNQIPGLGVVVGHPDTGYRKHPGIVGNLLIEKGHDFVDGDDDAQDELVQGFLQNPSHGTGTASVIIGRREDKGNYPSGRVVTGIAPGARLIPFRVAPSVVLGSPDDLSAAIEQAADRGAHVISISMGTGFFNKRLRIAVLYAQKRGVIVLAAAGNYVGYVIWPAAYDEVIAVAASNAQRRTWWASSRGQEIDVTAPGESVWRAQVYEQNGTLTNDVLRGTGTSFAVAAVAGVAALWLSYHKRDQLIQRYGAEKIPFIFNQILRDSCDNVPTWDQGSFGAGLVNARKVLAAPLPDAVNFLVPSAAFALEQHVAVDSGGLSTFSHLFQANVTPSPNAAGFVSIDPSSPQLRARLAQLLRTTEQELPSRLKEVGQELAFHFTVNPELYNRFVAALSRQESDPAALAAVTNAGAPSADIELIRGELLLEQDASNALRKKIS